METTDTAGEKKRTIKQVVVREFGDVGKYRVRLVRASQKADAPTHLDVREYVRGANYEGFTRRGVRLAMGELASLKVIFEQVAAEASTA